MFYISIWLLVTILPMDIYMISGCSPDHNTSMTFGADIGHGHQQRPSCNRTTDPGRALDSSPDLDITIASGSSSGHSDHDGPWQLHGL